MLNLALGFYAILAIFEGKFLYAAWAIVASHFCDIIDGRVARMTNSTSSFGIEFDSFADWISFGIAPAIMMYHLILYKYEKLGFAIALFYVIAGSLRLAKFNIRSFEQKDEVPSYFTGLPIPAAGGMLAAFVLVYQMFYQEITHKTIPLLMKNIPTIARLMPVLIFFLGVAMVSNVKWNNFKKVKFSRPKPLRTLVTALIFVLLLYAYTENVIFLLYLTYFLWGITELLMRVKNWGKRGQTDGQK